MMTEKEVRSRAAKGLLGQKVVGESGPYKNSGYLLSDRQDANGLWLVATSDGHIFRATYITQLITEAPAPLKWSKTVTSSSEILIAKSEFGSFEIVANENGFYPYAISQNIATDGLRTMKAAKKWCNDTNYQLWLKSEETK